MSDEKTKERYKKVYVPNENAVSAHQNAAKVEEEERMSNSLADCLIVHKITGSESGSKEFEDLLDENEIHNLKAAELHEKKNLADDYETIVRKQLQILQADERGKLALQNEIADIKKRQQERSESLRARKKALLVEKERAKRIASRPPPLPRSVIMLLKEQEKKSQSAALDEILRLSQEYEEEENDSSENKENVLDEEEEEERRKLQEERDLKAKKRFKEAIKKEHQKQEHAEILKEIENAEKFNRRQLAKSVSVKGGRVPCLAPDSIFHTTQQVAMEDKVENIFKKNPKEHAVEDLEGYEDYWETKYSQIDSEMEKKMIDCVPSFVKENYAYLLEDESSVRCGRRFSGLDESRDEFNMAYIASPPSNEEIRRSKQSEETEAIINHLHQMQREINETIEKEFKPLLEIKDVPKTESVDKAVETDILKFPTEHKAVGVQSDSPKDPVSTESKSVEVDLMNRGVMGYKRGAFSSRSKIPGDIGSAFGSPEEKRLVLGPSTAQESWSSSSYWSLPSRHGLPNVCNICDSPNCNVPLVEHKASHNTCIPLSKSKETYTPVAESRRYSEEEMPLQNDSHNSSYNSKLTSGDKSKLSYYVQIVADKYLKNQSGNSPESSNRNQSDKINYEQVKKSSSALESSDSEFNQIEAQKSHGKYSLWEDKTNTPKTSGESSRKNFKISDDNTSTEMPVNSNPMTVSAIIGQSSKYHVSEHNFPRSPEFATNKSSPIDMNEPTDDVFVQKCHEVISDNLKDLLPHLNKAKTISLDEDSNSFNDPALNDVFESPRQPYVYHELSTIQEMDSALTNDCNRSSYGTSKRSLGSGGNVSNKSEKMESFSDPINTTPISLVDVPPDQVSELAKSIRFIKKTSPTKASRENSETPQIAVSISPSRTQPTEARAVSSAAITTNSSELSSAPSLISNYGTPLTLKTTDFPDGSCGSLASSLQSAHPSPLSVGSQEIQYASSFSSPFKNQHHLTTLPSLPKYFPDISSIRNGSESSSSSQYGGSQSSKTIVDNRSSPSGWSDKQDFNTLQDNRYGSSSDSFKPMTPHTNLPSPNGASVMSKINREQSSCGSFKPMTPRSDLSSPSTAYYKYKSPTPVPGSSQRIRTAAEQSPQKSNVIVPFGSPDSSSSQFYPMTPCSYTSSQSGHNPKEDVLLNHSHGNVHEIGHDYSSHVRDHNNQKSQMDHSYHSGESRSSFQPLTPLSQLPSQSEFIPRSQSEFVSPGPRGFLLSDPSQLVSPDVNKFHMKKKNSPADLRLKVLHSVKSSTDGSFQPLSPRSSISVSSVTNFLQQNISTDVVLPNDQSVCKPVKFKLDFKAKNFMNPDNDSAQYMVGDGSELRLPCPGDTQGLESGSTGGVAMKPPQKSSEKKSPKAAKVCSSDFFNPQLSAGDFQGMQSTGGLIEGSLQESDMPTPVQKPKEYTKGAKACGSEFFLPHLTSTDFGHFKGLQSSGALIEGSLQDSEMLGLMKKAKSPTKKPKEYVTAAQVSEVSKPQVSSTGIGHFQGMRSTGGLIEGSFQSDMHTLTQKPKELPKGAKVCGSGFFKPHVLPADFGNPEGIQSIESTLQGHKPDHLSLRAADLFSRTSSKSTAQNTGHLITNPSGSKTLQKPVHSSSSNKSPNLILEALERNLMSDGSGNLPFQCRTPSKITHQSTPVKTIEELIQETGILDEQDLTLVNTNFTIKHDSPEKLRDFIEDSRSLTINAAMSNYNFSLMNSTSTAKNAVMQSFCDSPSMLSFLQHEQSCLQDSKAGATAGSVPQLLFDESLQQKKIATSPNPVRKTPRSDYRNRTKRLWNNLEEVRKRKLMEEKRDQLLKNRLKMKTYSKNLLTPKKKD